MPGNDVTPKNFVRSMTTFAFYVMSGVEELERQVARKPDNLNARYVATLEHALQSAITQHGRMRDTYYEQHHLVQEDRAEAHKKQLPE